MKKMWIWLLVGAVSLTTACEKSDGNDLSLLEKNHPEVVEALMSRYPAARVVDVDYGQGLAEIDIVDGSFRREVWYTMDGSWRRTETDLRTADLPSAVSNAWKSSEYGNYRVDEVDLIDSPEGSYYRLDLEMGGKRDVILKIDPNGVLLS